MIESPYYDMVKEEGIEEGAKKNQLEVAQRMLEKNYPLKDILEVTGLTEYELRQAGLL